MFTNLIETEPAMTVAVITGLTDAALILGVTFGLPITPDQKTAIDGFITAAVAFAGFVLSGVVTRSKVSPVAPSAS